MIHKMVTLNNLEEMAAFAGYKIRIFFTRLIQWLDKVGLLFWWNSLRDYILLSEFIVNLKDLNS